MSATFAWETVDALLAEPYLPAMLEEYWHELSPIKEAAPLDPDYANMRAAEAAGLFRIWAARKDGMVIGFVMFHIHPHFNYKRTLFAFDSGHYLDPSHRDSDWTGIKMWRSALDALADLGVKVVIAHDNALRPLEPFFLRLGFKLRSRLYWKVL